MAIYEYRCRHCHQVTEHLVRNNIAPMGDCCDAPDLCRIVSASSFVLKSGGWYKDGYRDAAPVQAASAGADE